MDADMAGILKQLEYISSFRGGFQQSIVMNTAVELDLFNLLHAEGPLDAAQVADRLELDERATDIVMHALAGMALLEVDERHRFSNSVIADNLLVRGRKWYQGDIFLHSRHLTEVWIHLPEIMRTGKPADVPGPRDDKEQRRNFILGMDNLAKLSVGHVADALGLSAEKRLLDVGGGPGTFTLEFCRRCPEMTAVLFDLPEVVEEISLEQVARAGLSDRIACRRGNYLTDDLGDGYDLVLISNIIHSLSAEETLLLLKRCADAMVRGGRLVLKDFLLEENRKDPLFASLFAVNMLVNTHGGKCYTAQECRNLLSRAGLEPGELIDLSPQARMLVGVKN